MLWGKHAQSYKKFITNETHLILESSHPSPLGANKGVNPFIGCKHFSKANEFLLHNNKKEVIW